jgi:site-specific recombinase XerD
MIRITTRVRSNRLNKEGEALILAMLYQGKTTKEISSGIHVKPEFWDSKRQLILNKDPSAQIKNSKLRKFLSSLKNRIDEDQILYNKTAVEDTVQRIKGIKKEDPYLVEYVKSYIDLNPEFIKEGTALYYNTCLYRLREFKPKVLMSQVDSDFLSKFEKFLKTEHGNSQNTVFNRLKVIRRVCIHARREGVISHNPFEFYKIKTEDTKRDFLTVEELKSLMALQDLTESEDLIRDVYVFSALSGGLRFGDISTLSTNQLEIKGDEYRLRLKMGKTEEYIYFKLSAKSIELIKKYEGKGVGTYVFPILPEVATDKNYRVLISRRNAYFNKVIKTLAEKADIKKHLTMHTARHSFATISLSNNVQTEVVGKIMGHKDLKTTQIYTNILDERKDAAIDKLNELF